MVGWKVFNFIENTKWKIFYKKWFDNLTSQISYVIRLPKQIQVFVTKRKKNFKQKILRNQTHSFICKCWPEGVNGAKYGPEFFVSSPDGVRYLSCESEI